MLKPKLINIHHKENEINIIYKPIDIPAFLFLIPFLIPLIFAGVEYKINSTAFSLFSFLPIGILSLFVFEYLFSFNYKFEKQILFQEIKNHFTDRKDPVIVGHSFRDKKINILLSNGEVQSFAVEHLKGFEDIVLLKCNTTPL